MELDQGNKPKEMEYDRSISFDATAQQSGAQSRTSTMTKTVNTIVL